MRRNLASNAIVGNLLGTASFIALGLFIQSIYLVVDLHFVARLGEEALAGVSIVSLASLITNATYQVICIGAIALVGRALGADDTSRANRMMSAAMTLAVICTATVFVAGYSGGPLWMNSIAATDGTARAARTYLFTALPSYALMFPVAVLSSVLRAAGSMMGATLVFVGSTLVKAALTPLLVNGAWEFPTLNVAGAGLASSLSIGGSLIAMCFVLRKHDALRMEWPQWDTLVSDARHVLRIGIPASAEMGMVFLTTVTIQWALRDSGAVTQAGFGAAMRMAQILLAPGMAVALALVPQVAHCLGAGHHDRRRKSLWWALGLTAVATLSVTLVALLVPRLVLTPIVSGDLATLDTASTHLAVLSIAFVPTGVAYVASAYGQGIGRTLPALYAACVRVPACVAPICALSLMEKAAPLTLLWISVGSVWIQALAAWLLLFSWQRSVALPSEA
ncbi:MATE family efflux transporter [Luteimonas sp. TWI1416]|uniref:MATE family efflux transporter n=1 Tax=unclassified Luteimonas TaxID=2629088 RepID=UPI00320B3FC0